ncbi:hypothetical protein D3I60_00020 [Brevibacterium permense]|nr:hypothetical protein [Brevibacterium permense]
MAGVRGGSASPRRAARTRIRRRCAATGRGRGRWSGRVLRGRRIRGWRVRPRGGRRGFGECRSR